MADNTNAPENGNENENSNENKSEDVVSKEELTALQEQLAKQEELINKLRTHEKTSLTREEEAKKAAEAEKERRKGIEGEFDSYKAEVDQRFRDLAVNATLENALIKENVHNVNSAMKLIDKSRIDLVDGKANADAIAEVINTLRETDAYLFKSKDDGEQGKPPANSAARSGERKATNSFADDLSKIKDVRELQKYLNQQ